MSSHNRERAFGMRRTKGTISDYRTSPVPKSRSEMSSRKKVFSSRGPPMEEKPHREYLKPSKRGLDDRREYDDRKDYPPMKKSRETYQSSSKESYGRSTKDESFEPKSRDSYLSRGSRDSFSGKSTRGSMSGRGSYGSSSRGGGRGSFGSSRGGRESYVMRSSKPQIRESYPPRGSYGYPRGSRDSYSSRGSFAQSRGRGESFSSRGRDSYSSRGRDSYSRGREAYPGRGKDSGRGRESYPVRGREFYPTRMNENYSGRGRDSYSARGRDTYPSRGMKTSNRGGYHGPNKRVSKYDDFASNNNNTRTTYEMSKKMSSMNEDHYEENRMFDMKRSSRSFIEKDSARTFKEPSSTSRSFSHHHQSSSSSLSHGEKFSHKRERSSSASNHYDKERYPEHISKRKSSKDKFEVPTKRSFDEDDDDDDQIGHHPKDHRDGPPHKQQRLLKKQKKYRESESQEYHRTRSASPIIKEEKVREHTQERDRSKSRAQERAKKREERGSKGSVGKEVGGTTTVEEEGGERRRAGRVKSRELSLENISAEDSATHEEEVEEEGKVLPPDEEEHEEPYERRRERSPGGVQITIRSDGERAVNSDGFVKPRIAGKVFVDLHCPHCPGQNSITFKKYRYHLDSRNHRHKIEKLAYKHSIVLRRIRRQQRTEQKEIEEKWETEKPDEFKDVISTYCKMCKLAYKSLPDRVDEHNDSKLHKIQQRYLHPKCEMCRMSFPSRMVYEYHIASIRHLRMLSMCNKNGDDGTPDPESKEEKEEIDLTNFITMDSVGEDEEVGSEKEEITGNLEDIEKAEEDAKEGEEGDEDEHAEGELIEGEEDEFVMDVEDDADYQDQDEEQFDPVGKDFIEPMEAVYCKLCHKALRIDTEIGEEIIERHCSTVSHIDNLQFANSDEYVDGEEENYDEAPEDLEGPDPVAEVTVKVEVEEEDNPEDRQDYEIEEEEEEEEEPNYKEDMAEHGEDIDLEEKASSKSSKSREVKQNGK